MTSRFTLVEAVCLCLAQLCPDELASAEKLNHAMRCMGYIALLLQVISFTARNAEETAVHTCCDYSIRSDFVLPLRAPDGVCSGRSRNESLTNVMVPKTN